MKLFQNAVVVPQGGMSPRHFFRFAPTHVGDYTAGAAFRCGLVASSCVHWTVTLAAALLPILVHANPQGMAVQSGTASAQINGSHLQINASHNAFLNWNSFNIARGESTTFVQPSATSVVWNRIHDQNPSTIFGSLQANGIVVLANPNGFFFGPDAYVKAAGLMVTTAPIESGLAGGGLAWTYSGPPPLAAIINHGLLETCSGG